jgi:hypothetical protein
MSWTIEQQGRVAVVTMTTNPVNAQAVDLRPPDPAPASGERRDPPEAVTLGSFRMPLADGHSRGRRCVACWHLRV